MIENIPEEKDSQNQSDKSEKSDSSDLEELSDDSAASENINSESPFEFEESSELTDSPAQTDSLEEFPPSSEPPVEHSQPPKPENSFYPENDEMQEDFLPEQIAPPVRKSPARPLRQMPVYNQEDLKQPDYYNQNYAVPDYPSAENYPPSSDRGQPVYGNYEPVRNAEPSISQSDVLKLMQQMAKVQSEAERAISAANKAWMAAEYAADSAQIARQSENSLTEKATDAVKNAAEKIRMQTEELAKEAANKALAQKIGEIDTILPKFEQLLEDKKDFPKENELEVQKAIELFKSFKSLGESLPDNSRKDFMQSKSRIKMDYIIDRLSGNEGLLKISQRLRDSGAVIDYVREAEVPLNYKGKRLCSDVLTNMKHFVCDLDDKDLSVGLNNIVSDVIKKLSHT